MWKIKIGTSRADNSNLFVMTFDLLTLPLTPPWWHTLAPPPAPPCHPGTSWSEPLFQTPFCPPGCVVVAVETAPVPHTSSQVLLSLSHNSYLWWNYNLLKFLTTEILFNKKIIKISCANVNLHNYLVVNGSLSTNISWIIYLYSINWKSVYTFGLIFASCQKVENQYLFLSNVLQIWSVDPSL